ncbi:MAG: hypothetical protein GKS06_17840 [Acidobacteria bacterium]|nr:hypothetical protein [Acidobacteriota bacterium]
MLARSLVTRLGIVCAAIAIAGCAETDPEIVAIEYLRATREAQSDTALTYLDMDEIADRVSAEIVLVNPDGDSDSFLRESVSSLIWGLFQETPREDLAYDATPADVNGDRATVRVTLLDAEGGERTRTVHLRRTDAGWKVSGRSLDHLVSYAITRLEERF